MRLMQFIGLRHLLPRFARAQLRERWEMAPALEQHERRFYAQFVRLAIWY